MTWDVEDVAFGALLGVWVSIVFTDAVVCIPAGWLAVFATFVVIGGMAVVFISMRKLLESTAARGDDRVVSQRKIFWTGVKFVVCPVLLSATLSAFVWILLTPYVIRPWLWAWFSTFVVFTWDVTAAYRYYSRVEQT